jgi:hypothetical protein
VIADPASLTVLVNHAIFKRRDYNGSEIAMLLWAVDKLELPIMTELTAAMTSRIVEAKDSFSARNIAMTLTTLAKDGTPMDTAVSAALVKRAVTIRATFDEQAIARRTSPKSCSRSTVVGALAAVGRRSRRVAFACLIR